MGGNTDDLLSAELRRILDGTTPGTVVDVGAHSLGTSLVATAYQTDDSLQDRVRQTYWYNPVFSPFAALDGGNVTDKYEADERVRWFIDLLDPVSLGDLGSAGPKNAVYRTNFSWNPIGPHSLTAWAGDYIPEDVTPNQEKENVVAQQRDEVPTQGMGDAFGAGGLLDFGTDNWDAAAFGL